MCCCCLDNLEPDEAKWLKQKESTEKHKLLKMQNPTIVQLNEKVEEEVEAKMESAVPNTVQSRNISMRIITEGVAGEEVAGVLADTKTFMHVALRMLDASQLRNISL